MSEQQALGKPHAVILGSGRLIRALLVPSLVELGCDVVVVQPKSKDFVEYMDGRGDSTYEVDTVLVDGQVVTTTVPLKSWTLLETPEGRKKMMALPRELGTSLAYVGVGVTEAGLAHNTLAMQALAEFLFRCREAGCVPAGSTLSVINTDNVPDNGSSMRKYVASCDFTQGLEETERGLFRAWLDDRVCFHNSMVDRITGAREGNTSVPRTEPLPNKALVIEDLLGVLPTRFESLPGFGVRRAEGEIALDHQLKLRIANATHTAMVYAMTVAGLPRTDLCIGHELVLPFLEQIFEKDIVVLCKELHIPRSVVWPVYSEWVGRLQHPHFGMSCLWVAQNAHRKLGIRLLPTIKALMDDHQEPSPFMAFAVAAMLRFLTPMGDQPRLAEMPPVFCGRMDGHDGKGESAARDQYSPGLHCDFSCGWYEFQDGMGTSPLLLRQLVAQSNLSVEATTAVAGDVLATVSGPKPSNRALWDKFVSDVGGLLHDMLSGTPVMSVLAALRPNRPIVLAPSDVMAAVVEEVQAAEAIDLHTHLFEAEHGHMLWGIDELLTYHYLVSEHLTTTGESPAKFAALSKQDQASRVWQSLFVERAPLSEACRGVLTTLNALGLAEDIASRDLARIRQWFAQQNPHSFTEKMFRLARVRCVVTTNNPFDAEERKFWRSVSGSSLYRRSLCIDCLGDGSWDDVVGALKDAQQPLSAEGLRSFLEHWASVMKPEYLTMATAFDWQYPSPQDPTPWTAAARPSSSVLLDQVVMPVCAKLGLPLALRMGTKRRVGKQLLLASALAGDGLGAADLHSLARLCSAFPKQKFLATFLSVENHHEACALSSKLPNLHLFGCWWYCNTPSITKHVTQMRLELIGNSFTAIASSARVHDQLIYKWIHARAAIAEVLGERFECIANSGWSVSRQQVRKDVGRLLGGSYEEFRQREL